MFKKRTVFVVGAGASKEVGLPTGDQLKLQIGAKLDLRFENGYDLTVGDRKVLDAIRLIVQDLQQRDVNPHCQAGRTIASAMHQALSIDNFLHAHADNDLIVQVGKLGIAATILEAEKASAIYQRDDGRINFGAHPNIWHNTFCKMLTEQVQRNDLSHLFANVAFITFNYDRCIEHYVAGWLANYFQLRMEEAQELTNQLTVIHPYGQIGKLPWQNRNLSSVPYGSGVEPRYLPKIASHIRTFTEQVEDETEIEKMTDLLSEAQQVVYLGFSYGAMNLALMKLKKHGPQKSVVGTAYGLSPPNLKAIHREIFDGMKVAGDPLLIEHAFENLTCNDLLNNYFRAIA